VSGGDDLPRARRYGTRGPWVVVVHGGPGAPGSMAPVARELSDEFRVLEPFEERAGEVPVTVASLVAGMHACIVDACGTQPLLVGHSWGAMLALAFAAEHPQAAGALALVGCGTFDAAARREFEANVAARLTGPARAGLARLRDAPADTRRDADLRLRRTAQLLLAVYAHDLATSDDETVVVDSIGHGQAWRDMLRLQEEGALPRRFSAIRAPVLMIHGAADPHPGRRIRDGLAPHLPQLEYAELPDCGHHPWLERRARAPFFALLRAWLRGMAPDPERGGAARSDLSAN